MELLLAYAANSSVDIMEMEIMPDHVHILMEADPQFGIHKAVKSLRGYTRIMQKGVKFRIYPNREQQNLINQALGCCRLVYNRGLAMLTYKAAWYGNDIVKIPTMYPSSQTCSCCGECQSKEKGMQKVRRNGGEMVYKKFQDLELSALGLGAMRLPVLDGDDSKIDEASAGKMVDYAMEQGINYYDTAWGYHNGNSELVIGRALKKYPRESFCLATKFPGYDLSNMDKAEAIFEKQLEKCQVEYFDFYLFHNVCEMNIDAYLDKTYGIFDYLMEQKEKGRIRHLGFSVHGSYDTTKRFLEAYGEHMEFCQIQLNYLDWSFQDAKAKVELLREYQIPVWVMEPLRGGRLAKLSEEAQKQLQKMRPEEKAPAWAFRFLQGIPEVTMVLSGMSNFEQLRENIDTFGSERPLNPEEEEALLSIAEGMLAGTLPCTACKYCVSHCPQGLEIPSLLELYNEHSFTGGGFIAPMALMAVPKEKQPGACIGCRSCEAVCPQQIKISEAMKDFASKLG